MCVYYKTNKKGEECLLPYEPAYWFYHKFNKIAYTDDLYNKSIKSPDVWKIYCDNKYNIYGDIE